MHEEGGKPFHLAATPGVAHVQMSALGQRQDEQKQFNYRPVRPKTIFFH
jgi:hypothetical protein